MIPMNTAVPPIDYRQHRVKQLTTGLCIIIFIISLAFPVYLIVITVKKPVKTESSSNMITVMAPTLEMYAELHAMFPETLKCPCSKPSIYFGYFIDMEYTFHEICSSDFVSQEWIDHLIMPMGTRVLPNDFRSTGSAAFQALRTFCDQTHSMMIANLDEFYSTRYFSAFVTPMLMFHHEILMQIDRHSSSTVNSFLLSLSMVRSIIQNNALFSGLQTNYRQTVENTDVISSAIEYQGCSCASSPTCSEPSRIYDQLDMTSLFTIPGFRTGCYVIESLLRSDLQCFYDQNCIDELQTYLPSSMQAFALDSSMPTRFPPNTTIEELLSTLMVEQYMASVSYGHYYDQCQPMHCTYNTGQAAEKTTDTTEVKNLTAYLIGILIGIIGGIIAILNVVVPRLAKLIVYGIRHRAIEVNLDTPMTQ